MSAVLITGGAGFIGSQLADRLLSDGEEVILLDNFDPFYDEQIKRRNIAGALRQRRCRLVEGDIRDSRCLDGLFEKYRPGSVVHLAAKAGVRPSIADPAAYVSVNLDGTVNLLEACRRHGVDRFLFGSSSSVYGNNRKIPFAEDDPVDHPISPYAATKKAGEVLCHSHHHLFGIKIACLRFFTVYGPRQRPEMAIHKFVRAIERGDPIEQYGDGSSARDYTCVSDIVRGIRLAMDKVSGYHVWNLGGSRTITLAELIARIAAKLGKEAEIRIRRMQPGDVERTWADTSRVERELGWSPSTVIDEGLEEFIEWFRKESE